MEIKNMTAHQKAIKFAKQLRKLLKLANKWVKDPNLTFLKIEFSFSANYQSLWGPINDENQTTEENL